ncbi:putative hydrolase of the HAD superfamily [Halogranum amylolyticum]|uniref:Putative hydrolase of the HAD superfamily n=1 Tax=Halogranum amylolyticum TaxID=660520 RepID=A0A1H8RHF4_9EURY|nr:HAD family hydrolase [Halogranum amylolyticum]SEO65835.1 putative hydrolase of the HAD superfamily [Halogranum amylolyticum]
MTAIYVDLDGTLLQYDRSFADIFADACEQVGVAPPEKYQQYYVQRFFDRFAAFHDDPFLAAACDLRREFGLDVDPVAFRDARVDAELAATTVAAGVRDALDALGREHRLGVLSNGIGAVQREKLAVHDLLGLFDAVVVSHDVGATKPDEQIFETAELRLPADEHVYVGDDAEDDVGGAVDSGWKSTVHVVADDADCPGCRADLHVAPDEFDRLGEVL